MQETLYIISRKDLFDLFGRLSADHRVLVPYAKGERLYFDDFDPKLEDRIELGGIRQSQPVKSFINPPREEVSSRQNGPARPLILAGVKGCDLSSLALQDFVFLGGEVEDGFYARNRRDTILIGCDCSYAKETCFCLAMEGAPYPKQSFDICLSALDNSFVVEIGSARGQSIVDAYKVFFKQAPYHSASMRRSNRDRTSRQVRGYIDKRQTPDAIQTKGIVKKHYSYVEFWQDMASTCVECGACNLVCPTCHCFLLYDEGSARAPRRLRGWDACLYSTFARVAGNHNPRKHLFERLRNRFDKKFEFFPQVMNYFACTGCGRCIEACPGDIDIREVLKGLVNGKWTKPPHE
jgi:formate hydrogenlyase subunit 6/NADH:ubiquinone oxidoreductase subunit I